MASVNGVNNTNMSTLYGNRNVLTGLASGMDTESMIENSVSGIRLKLSTLQQQQTKLQWKQEGCQGITDKLVQFSRKYTSYTSSTNLLSSSFFSRAVTTTTSGENASTVSATGRSNSNLQLNGVAQLATSSRYQVSSGAILNTVTPDKIQADISIDLSTESTTSNLSGNLTLNYGSQSVTVNFTDNEVFNTTQEFADAINTKLAEQNITFDGGTTKKACDVIQVTVTDDKITFTDKESAGNAVYVKDVSGRLQETLAGADFSAEAKNPTLDLSDKDLTRSVDTLELLGGKSMSFTLDGSTKQITLPTAAELGAAPDKDAAFTALLQEKLNTSFGDGKITVSDIPNEDTSENGLRLSFAVKNGSSLRISSEVNETLNLEKSATTYLNTSKTLGELNLDIASQEGAVLLRAEGTVTEKDGIFRDAKGNLVNEAEDRLGKDGELLYGNVLTINGQPIGTYHRDSSLESVMLSINSNAEAGVSLSYSKMTNEFVFAAKETGAGHSISFEGELATSMFGSVEAATYSEGTDAVVNMTVNGTNLTLTRSSNTFDVDGMSVTVSGTFNNLDADGNPVLDVDGNPAVVANPTDPVSFTTSSDADKIVSSITDMVKDYNAMITELRSAFSTLPEQKSNGGKYEPLTDSDRESMSESAIKNYEEKAKQGILFGDRDLSTMYSKLVSAISPSGSDGQTLRNLGLSTDYTQGLTTLSLDENKLRDILKTNPDTVRDAFTKVSGEGGNTNGLMENLKTTLDMYSSVEGTKGILINKAGSKYSVTSLLQNSIKSQVDAFETQIGRWQDKLSSKVDYYTRQFTRLEQLVSQMNSQSSSLTGMMGG